MEVNRKYIYVSEKAPIYMSHSKAPKSSKFSITNIREKPVDFFYSTERALTLAPEIIFTNLGSFAKVSVPVKSTISCVMSCNHTVHIKFLSCSCRASVGSKEEREGSVLWRRNGSYV